MPPVRMDGEIAHIFPGELQFSGFAALDGDQPQLVFESPGLARLAKSTLRPSGAHAIAPPWRGFAIRLRAATRALLLPQPA